MPKIPRNLKKLLKKDAAFQERFFKRGNPRYRHIRIEGTLLPGKFSYSPIGGWGGPLRYSVKEGIQSNHLMTIYV